jgi:methionyl aminopeptidase
MTYENIITTEKDYKTLKKATEISVSILKELRDNVVIDRKASEINALAEELCQKYKVKASFQGVPGPKSPFPSLACVSVNDEILHAIPYKSKVFKNGDVVKIDFGIVHEGFYTDHCVTVGLGELTEVEKKLISTAKLCVDTAVKQAIVGNKVSDISYALQTVTELSGFDYVTTYCGHGIGKKLHTGPEITSYVYSGNSPELVEGMVLCIENQVVIGNADLKMDSDGWTLRTIDGTKGAMFEHMVIVREGQPEILTLLD